jgi:hypothetical protein
VRTWEIVIPLAAVVVIGYTLYRNVWPYPDGNPGQWFPVVAGGWILLVVIVAFAVPGFAQRLSVGLQELDRGDTEGEAEVVSG